MSAAKNDRFDRIARFVLDEELAVPESALTMAVTLLLDTVGVASGAAGLEAGRIARDFAVDFHGAGQGGLSAPLMFDGRLTSVVGAAFAAATQIDNLDGHDGYNPTKGHIGCAVVPALFAFAANRPDLSGRQALVALVMAYEVAARAGIALHATVSDYHTSGAWNALGVAALACRLMKTDRAILREALGIAEYHGPRSQMMREIDNPSMLHDGSGMGAMAGASAALLAARGFRGSPAITAEAKEVAPFWQDLGDFWSIEHNYIKPYPICRWAHAAIDAVRQLMQGNRFGPDDIVAVKVRTFHEAACLFSGMPKTSSQAQYSLAYAITVMLRHGHIGPEHIDGPALWDPLTADLLRRISIVEAARHSARFPQGRWSDVEIILSDGSKLASGDVHARGGPEAPMEAEEIKAKFQAMTAHRLPRARSDAIWKAGHALLQPGVPFSRLSDLTTPQTPKEPG